MAFRSLRDDSGRVIDFVFTVVNRKAEQIVGRRADDLLGQQMLLALPGNKTDGLFDAYVEVVETGEPFLTEHYYAHDGLNHWFSISATQCGDGFAVTFADITERKAHEEELLKLSMIASRTDNGVVLTDARGRIEWVNRAFTTLTGYALQEVEGRVPPDFLAGPESDPDTIAYIRDHMQRGAGFGVTVLKYRKDRTTYWSDLQVQPMLGPDGEVAHFMAVERDATERIMHDRAIQEQRRRLEYALDASRSGLWDWDIESGQNYLSDSWYTMLGYEPGELPMHVETWYSIAEPGDLERAKAALEAYFNGETERYACEMRIKNKTGHWQWIMDVGEAIERDADGRVTRMVGLHLDIHAQKLAQLELKEARDQAQQASDAKSAFVANMSHEIRTPMNAILGYADLLLDTDQTEADRRNHAKTIQRNGRHLMGLLNDVLDVSKIEAGKMSIERVPCSPAKLLTSVITLMMPRAMEKGIGLDFEESGPLPERVKTDPTRLRQVMLNLIGNAIKFTAEGSVRVAVRSQTLADGGIELACDVIDTGIGIEPEQLEQLFQPFSQADGSTTRRFGGTGLGLTISHSLCNMLGGSLTCTSTPGCGSTFSATFRVEPCETASPEPCTAAEPATGADTAPLDGFRLLVVEDGADNQRLIRHYLTKAGAEVEVAENGAEGRDAVLAAEDTGRPFDVVLMDMQMPVLDGYDATRALRAVGIRRPIVALTAHASPADRQFCLDAGCSDYLTKPIDRDTLVRVVAGHAMSVPVDLG